MMWKLVLHNIEKKSNVQQHCWIFQLLTRSVEKTCGSKKAYNYDTVTAVLLHTVTEEIGQISSLKALAHVKQFIGNVQCM